MAYGDPAAAGGSLYGVGRARAGGRAAGDLGGREGEIVTGTRCLTRVYDGDDQLCCIYRQMDGYPSSHGQILADFLKQITIVNGIGQGRTAGQFANGAGCLAAQLVSHLKEGIGGIYLYPISVENVGQDYDYSIRVDHGIICLFSGDPMGFDGRIVEGP